MLMRFMMLSILAAMLLVSCHFFAGERVTGDGHVTVLDRHVTGQFDKVDVSGSVQVHVKQEADPSVRIETDQNLMEYIEVFAEGGTLVIRTKRGYNLDPSKEIIAYVSAPSFRDIDVSGACDIIGDGPISDNQPLSLHVSGDGEIKMQVELPKIETEISGSGSVQLSGKAGDFNASISGSGDVKCFDLVTDHTTLELSGAADAQVTANKTLGVEVSGSGNVQYKGNAVLEPGPSISGSGSVKKVD